MTPLDTKKLQELCEAVVRDSKGYNTSDLHIARDHDWASLTEYSLPALEKFIQENKP